MMKVMRAKSLWPPGEEWRMFSFFLVSEKWFENLIMIHIMLNAGIMVVEERMDIEADKLTQLVSRAEDRAGEKSAKILQSECWLGFIFRKTSRKTITALFIPVSTPLRSVDSCTGEAVMKCEEEHMSIPMVKDVENMEMTFAASADQGTA